MSDKILTGEEIRLAIIPLLKRYRAEKAILFDSYARNEADGKSDIDILIIGGEHFVPTDVFCIADELYCQTAFCCDLPSLRQPHNTTPFCGSPVANSLSTTPTKCVR